MLHLVAKVLFFSTAEGQNNNLCSYLNKNIYLIVHLNTEVIIPIHASKAYIYRYKFVFWEFDWHFWLCPTSSSKNYKSQKFVTNRQICLKSWNCIIIHWLNGGLHATYRTSFHMQSSFKAPGLTPLTLCLGQDRYWVQYFLKSSSRNP